MRLKGLEIKRLLCWNNAALMFRISGHEKRVLVYFNFLKFKDGQRSINCGFCVIIASTHDIEYK